jgi:hypothetical protein
LGSDNIFIAPLLDYRTAPDNVTILDFCTLEISLRLEEASDDDDDDDDVDEYDEEDNDDDDVFVSDSSSETSSTITALRFSACFGGAEPWFAWLASWFFGGAAGGC